MIGFDVKVNNRPVALAAHNALGGMGLCYKVFGQLGPNMGVSNNPQSNVFHSSLDLRGFLSETADSRMDRKVWWLKNLPVAIGDEVELVVVESCGDLEHAPKGDEKENKEEDLVFVPKHPNSLLCIEGKIGNDKPQLFAGVDLGSLHFNIHAVGFLGPRSHGNVSQRQRGITEGQRIFLHVHGVGERPVTWIEDREIAVGDRIIFRMIEMSEDDFQCCDNKAKEL